MDISQIIGALGVIAVAAVIVSAFSRRRAPLALSTKKRRIVGLDLTRVRTKAMKRNQWDDAKAKSLEGEYRDFLILLAENDGSTISPWSDDLDLFWHEHILDTAKYAADCSYLFGRFIRHNPHIEGRPYRHEEIRSTTIVLREAQLKKRAERRKAAGSTVATTAAKSGFDFVTWGCAASASESHGGSATDGHSSGSSHSSSHGDSGGHGGGGHDAGGGHGGGGHDAGGGHSDGGHSCGGGGHSCGGHSCGGHSCGGH